MADAHKNFAVSTVATAPSPASSGTSLVVASGHGTRFPATPFNAVVHPTGADPDPSNAEVVRVTNISTDTLTITRATESSSARSIVVGDRIFAAVTAKSFTDIETDLISKTMVDAKGDLLVGTGDDALDNLTVGVNGELLMADSTAATGTRWTADALNWARWKPSGVKVEAFPRSLVNGNATLISGTLHLTALALPLKAGVTYSSITFYNGGAVTTPTNQWFTLIDKANMQTLRTTPDDLTTAWGSQSFKTLTFASAYVPASDKDVYLGIMVAAATPPTIRRYLTISQASGIAPILCGASNTGQTTAPSDGTTMTAITSSTDMLYGVVS